MGNDKIDIKQSDKANKEYFEEIYQNDPKKVNYSAFDQPQPKINVQALQTKQTEEEKPKIIPEASNENLKIQADLKGNDRKVFFENLIRKSKLISENDSLKTYIYPTITLDTTENSQAKTMIVLGQSGSGKTTLLNALLNFLLGVEQRDPFRFILINENTGKAQSESQTSKVTLYQIKGYNGYPPLNIIDTPGFGDTRGIEFDKKIFEMISEFFKKELDVLHAVCFVSKSSDNRLTINQKYIFSRVFELFGEDIAENFVCMLTFCDGGEPNIVQALSDKNQSCFSQIKEKIKTPWYLKFNSSAIFAKADKDDIFSKLYWDVGMESFKNFMKMKINVNSPKSLTLTKEVLKERKKLEDTLNCLRPELDQCLTLRENIRKTINRIENNIDVMEANKNFRIRTTYQKPCKITLEPGMHTTTCLNCNRTCHNNCSFPLDSDKLGCLAMGADGYCNVCPKKCFWDKHSNLPYMFVYNEVTEEITAEELFKKYQDAESKKSKMEQVLDGLSKEFQRVSLHCLQLQNVIKESVEKLKSIALKKNLIESTSEYLDLMIQSESEEKKPGYQERVKGLYEMKIQFDLVKEICSEEKNTSIGRLIDDAMMISTHPETASNLKSKGLINKLLDRLKGFLK